MSMQKIGFLPAYSCYFSCGGCFNRKLHTFLSYSKEQNEMFKQKFQFSLFRYSVSVLGLWHQNTYTFKSHTTSELWREGILDTALSAFRVGQLCMSGLGPALFIAWAPHPVFWSTVSAATSVSLNLPERPSLTLRPAGQGQPVAILFFPDHNNCASNKEWSHLHIKSSSSPRNGLGGWYLAQTMTVSGTVVRIQQYRC